MKWASHLSAHCFLRLVLCLEDKGGDGVGTSVLSIVLSQLLEFVEDTGGSHT